MDDKNINREAILFGIIGLLAGLVIAGATAISAVNNDNHGMMRMMGMNEHSHNDGLSMNEMSDDLRRKTGNQFDESFLEMMIEHHEGAVEMAELAKQRAMHDEIKNLADDIISAQNSEIEMMRTWQEVWDYENDAMPMNY